MRSNVSGDVIYSGRKGRNLKEYNFQVCLKVS